MYQCFADVLEGTASHDNLKQAFAEESMACMRYLYFASIAQQEGFTDIAQTFKSLAESEQAHCFQWMGQLKVVADPLTNEPLGDTFVNLNAAISSEMHDNKDMYPKMAATAEKEGFHQLAQAFVDTALAEGRHAKKLQEASKQLQEFLQRPRQ
jgi:rubrerythrin